jgi:hypothetical protein
LEAASPAKTLPSKEELLAFQARWMRPAGIAAILGALIIAASLPLQPNGGGGTDAETLTELHSQHTELIVGQGILTGIAILLFVPLLYVLIKAAQGRTKRIRRGMVALAFVGPILFAIAGLIVAIGLVNVTDEFVDQAPAKERQAREQATATRGPVASDGSKREAPQTATTASTPSATQSGTTATTPDQAASKAREDLADDLPKDSTVLQIGTLVRFVGLLSLLFALIYIPLWAMRTGLLTRFWAILGMAFGVSLLLVPTIAIFGLVLWFAVVGLKLAGWWPGPLPPAWAEGEAIPWPSRGDIGPATERSDPGTVEGSGREVSEQGLQENGAGEDAEPQETQGQRRKKRKRRK